MKALGDPEPEGSEAACDSPAERDEPLRHVTERFKASLPAVDH
ncbi:hypothetical protein ACFXKG_12895 [Streptomyces sp. NPDC059255]